MRYRYIRIGETIPRDAEYKLGRWRKYFNGQYGYYKTGRKYENVIVRAPIHWWQIWYRIRAFIERYWGRAI